MAEFTDLPVAAGGLPTDNLWDEIRTALINRNKLLTQLGKDALWTGLDLPIERSVGDLVGLIGNYREKIDELAPMFVRDGEVYLDGGDDPDYFTTSTLHYDAFGYNNSGWDPSGAPNLSVGCLYHEDIWNNMKACLDLMKWVDVDNDLGNTIDNARSGTQYKNTNNDANWNTARGGAISGLSSGSPGNYGNLGVWADSYIDTDPDPDEYICYAEARTEWGITFQVDLGSLAPMPSVTKGKLSIRLYQPDPINPSPSRAYGPFSFDIYVESTKVNSSSFSYPGALYYRPNWLMDDLEDASINIDGTNNELVVQLLNTITDDPGATEYPAPTGSQVKRWIRGMRHDYSAYDEARWWIIFYFSWD